MTVTITIAGENAEDAMNAMRVMLGVSTEPTYKANFFTGKEVLPVLNGGSVGAAVSVEEVATAKPETEKKTRKPKEEKVAEPKVEVLAPEKPKYTLQDAIDRAREIAGDGKDEKVMVALKAINTRLGISKVREIPPEKLDGYMVELEKEFPKDAAKPADTNMFD